MAGHHAGHPGHAGCGGFSAVWGFCAIAALAAIASVASKNAPPRPAGAAGRGSLLPPAAVIPGLSVSLAALGHAALATFVSLKMLAHGVSDGIAAFGFTYIGVRLFIGNVPDRLGPRLVAIWSAIVEAAGLVIVAWPRTWSR